MSNPWFRLYTEMVDDEKLRLLAFEDRWHYVAILCCKGKGLIDSGDTQAMLMRKLSVKLGLTQRETETVLMRLEEVGLVDSSTAQPSGWNDRQFLSDVSTARVKAYREKVKREGNVSETAQEEDTDTDTKQKEEEANASLSAAPTCPHQQIVALYHEHLPVNPRIKIWGGSRAATLQARWREDPKRQNIEYWGRFFRHCAGSKFLTGQVEDRGGRPFTPGLDWLVKASNFAKIIEGRYHDRGNA